MIKLHAFIASLCLVFGSTICFAAETANPASNPPASPRVLIETSMGSFTLELDRKKAPETVSNFLAYVDMGFYDGTLFHRVIPGFVIQGGGFGSGMKKRKTGAPVVNESANGNKNSRGTISMARTRDPDSATSQFFINLRDNPNLDACGALVHRNVFGGNFLVGGRGHLVGAGEVHPDRAREEALPPGGDERQPPQPPEYR